MSQEARCVSNTTGMANCCNSESLSRLRQFNTLFSSKSNPLNFLKPASKPLTKNSRNYNWRKPSLHWWASCHIKLHRFYSQVGSSRICNLVIFKQQSATDVLLEWENTNSISSKVHPGKSHKSKFLPWMHCQDSKVDHNFVHNVVCGNLQQQSASWGKQSKPYFAQS